MTASHAHEDAAQPIDQARPRRGAGRAPTPPATRPRCRRRPPPPPRRRARRSRPPPARGLLERGGVGRPRVRGRARGEPARPRLRHRRAAPRRGRAARAPRRACPPPRSRPDLSATSSGSSANQPTSLTTTGLPSESWRMTLPDVSPIVGERRLTQTSQAAISDQSRSSSTYASRRMPSGQAEPLQAPVEVEAGRDGADEQQPCVGPRRRRRAKASSSCGIRLLALTFPKEPISGAPASGAAATGACSQAGCGIRQIGPRSLPPAPSPRRGANGRSARSPGRAPRRRGGTPPAALPERRDPLVEDAVASRRPTTPPSRSIASR